MSIVVEDGTGVAGAVAYSTVTELRAYVPRGGLEVPSGALDAALEAALVRGTAYVEAAYASRWPGVRETEDQGLSWPRTDALDTEGYELSGVPVAVKNACMEAALIEANEAGALTEALERGGMVVRKKTGPLEKEYAAGAPVGTVYPVIKQCLASIIRFGGGVRFTRG